MKAAVVLLAAGQSRRMGEPKLLLPWRTRTVLGQSLSAALCSPVSAVVVVTGFQSEAVESACHQISIDLSGHVPSLTLVHNPRWSAGMASSLQSGLANIAAPVDAFFVALGDMPLVSSTVYALLLNALAAEPDRIFIPVWQGQRGHPVLIPGALLDEALDVLRTLIEQEGSPDVGLRRLLRQHAAQICEYEVSCPGVVIDLDTPDEYTFYAPR